jgi:hypothetical protein
MFLIKLNKTWFVFLKYLLFKYDLNFNQRMTLSWDGKEREKNNTNDQEPETRGQECPQQD